MIFSKSKNPRFIRTVSQQGFSLVTTLFIIIFLMVLGTNMVKIGTSQQQVASLSLISNRAYYAALSGLEYCENEIANSGSATVCPTNCSTTGKTISTIEGFNVTVSCDDTNVFTEANETYAVFEINALASRGAFGDLEYVSRELNATVINK